VTGNHKDVVVIGAGAAGVAAAIELGRTGLSVVILEARNRIGGRIFTHRDPVLDSPIEFGAEFIHGKPPEVWEMMRERRAAISEVDGDNWCVNQGRLTSCDFFSQVDSILDKMSDESDDESFLEFLQRCFPERNGDLKLAQAKQRAVNYVSGFNAADPGLVGVHWLVKSMRAEETMDGSRAFRSQNGYADLLDVFRYRLAKAHVAVQTETVVEQIAWRKGKADVIARAPQSAVKLTASHLLVTLPLAVLQTAPGEVGAVRFDPVLPRQKTDAMNKLEMGKVIRVVLRFRERFWQSIAPSTSKNLSEMSFLFSNDEWFPTWWTKMPERLPIITGWAPFQSAERLSGRSREFVLARSLATLARLLGVGILDLERWLEAAYFHDWQSDPFSRGAYSYGKVGSDGAQEELGRPLDNTLFFAGEATDISGNNGTVHGAIASGRRAAREILHGLRSAS
jgi:monoamine oxidase